MRQKRQKAYKQCLEIKAESVDLKKRISKEKKRLDEIHRHNIKAPLDKDVLIKLNLFLNSVEECQEFLICCRKIKLRYLEEKLSLLIDKTENNIEKIPVSDLRLMFRLYYIDGLTWEIVALKMNFAYPGRKIAYTGDNCRIRHNRYLDSLNEIWPQ